MTAADHDIWALTATHWGIYRLNSAGGRLRSVTPWEGDPDPSPIGRSMLETTQGNLRIARPAVRRGWLERQQPGAAEGRRGHDPFVEIPWDEALDLVARELRRICADHGNRAIYGGSYGWASAGRFHHAQSQLHRFLNTIDGYTGARHTYSYGAAEVILPHVLGSLAGLTGQHPTWQEIAANSSLIVMFGGIPGANAQIQAGGAARHEMKSGVQLSRDAGVQFVNISPVRDDAPGGVDSEWLALRPSSDTALMLGLAHVLVTEDLCDLAFLERCCTGFERVRDYVLGTSDGVEKSPAWAAGLSGVDAGDIVLLARRMAAGRTMVMVSWSLQRADHGEQACWMAITLAALLGQIGLPGGGIGFGYGSTNGAGRSDLPFRWPSLPQGQNPVEDFIPVARVADMLLAPGTAYEFNGARRTYPDIRLVYWAGGNPFHHHQDLNRLHRSWQRPETVIVHEPFWTATARHADIVLPTTLPPERDDLGMSNREPVVVAMQAALPPAGEARDDYAILSALAARMGCEEAFTEGRDCGGWIAHLYGQARERAGECGMAMPSFETFWRDGMTKLDRLSRPETPFGAFRADPVADPLATPSGRIELFSERIAGFGYAETPGHAVWQAPKEWLGDELARTYPLHLLSPQPADKLHSQLDHGSVSLANKVAARAALRLNPQDAAARGIGPGDLVLVFNARGACLAGAVLTDALSPGVVQLPTGAWFDPDPKGGPERHGNPNVLTADRGTSRLGQGASCNSCLVQVERFDGTPPPLSVHEPPELIPSHLYQAKELGK